MQKNKLLLALVLLTALILLADKPFYIISKDGKAICGRCRVTCELKPQKDLRTREITWYAICPNCGRSAALKPEEYEFIKDHMEFDEDGLTSEGRHRTRHDETDEERITYIPIPEKETKEILRERPFACSYCGHEASGDSLFFFDRRTREVVPKDEVRLPLTSESFLLPVCWRCAKSYLIIPEHSDDLTPEIEK